MRFKLTLKVEKSLYGNQLPINYQYEQSGVIYKMLFDASQEYSTWLHDNGYQLNGKQFKLFTYSQLEIPQYQIDKQKGRFIIKSDIVHWYISFLPEQSTEKFIQGVFMNQSFDLGDRWSRVHFQIQQVELQPAPDLTGEASFETLSPLCLSKREEDGRTTYLPPIGDYAQQSIYSSLTNRYEAFYGKPYAGPSDFHFTLLSDPKPKLIKVKADTPQETQVKGYLCRFRLTTDLALMKILYETGVGVKGSQGWGMVKVIKSPSTENL